MPEYIQPLRQETEEVLAECGTWNKQALLTLAKMDSFMKESQRFNPLLLSKIPQTPLFYQLVNSERSAKGLQLLSNGLSQETIRWRMITSSLPERPSVFQPRPFP